MSIFESQPCFASELGMLDTEMNVNSVSHEQINSDYVLAMGYVPMQEFTDYYPTFEEALSNGTLFKKLVKPFRFGKGEVQ